MFLFVHNFSKPLDSLSGNGDNIDVVQHFLRFIHDDIYIPNDFPTGPCQELFNSH